MSTAWKEISVICGKINVIKSKNKNMEIETKVSPMEIMRDGEKVLDISPEQAAQATARLEADKAEVARLELERAANEKTSQESRQKEINDILQSLK